MFTKILKILGTSSENLNRSTNDDKTDLHLHLIYLLDSDEVRLPNFTNIPILLVYRVYLKKTEKRKQTLLEYTYILTKVSIYLKYLG